MPQLRKPFYTTCAQGNALMEYAVPACIILFSAGVMLTVTDSTKLLSEYFLSASGHTKSNLTGTTFKTDGLASMAIGAPSNGLEGFTAFATAKDGTGAAATGEKAGGIFYSGNITRVGARLVSTSTEYLFP